MLKDFELTPFLLGIPIVLIPVIAADPSFGLDVSAAAFAGTVASFASIGAAIGKFVNGFSVKIVGGRNTTSLYMIGIAIFSIMLSTTSNRHRYAIAGMEFCSSIIWVACSDIFSNKYEEDPMNFSKAITNLSLGATSGVVAAKVLGGTLIKFFHWRHVARVSALFALLGSCIIQFGGGPVRSQNIEVPNVPLSAPPRQPSFESGSFLHNILSSYSRIVKAKMVWFCILSHGICFAVRSSDKILGAFYSDVANLPGEMVMFESGFCNSHYLIFVMVFFVVSIIMR